MVIPKTALLSLITALSGVQCYWQGDPKPFVSPTTKATCELKAKRLGEVGSPEPRRVWSSGPNTQQEDQVGWRKFSLTIKVEDFGSSKEASEIVDLIQMKLDRQSSRDVLHASNLAIIEIQTITDLPTTYDKRIVSVAVAEITLATLVKDDLTAAEEDAGWIEHLNSDGDVPGP